MERGESSGFITQIQRGERMFSTTFSAAAMAAPPLPMKAIYRPPALPLALF